MYLENVPGKLKLNLMGGIHNILSGRAWALIPLRAAASTQEPPATPVQGWWIHTDNNNFL